MEIVSLLGTGRGVDMEIVSLCVTVCGVDMLFLILLFVNDY
jgi:hypothetical protein